MISKKLSLNKVCIILATTILLLSVVMFSVLYILTKEMSVVFCSMAFGLLFLLCVTAFVILIRRKWTAEALFNILDNAVKYTPEYGSIRVCVESWEMHLKVSITDTGKGIPENQQGAIFRRFYREEDVHDIEGIGIGLYLAREIISLQNGYIQVTSQVGTGSTFSVFLPHE